MAALRAVAPRLTLASTGISVRSSLIPSYSSDCAAAQLFSGNGANRPERAEQHKWNSGKGFIRDLRQVQVAAGAA